MTDKERLKEISNLLERYYSTEDSFEQTDLAIEIIQGHVNWIINRVEELEEREKLYKETIQSYGRLADGFIDDIESLVKRNEHYKQALEFYADEENYMPNVFNQWEPVIKIWKDSGEKARKALKGETK